MNNIDIMLPPNLFGGWQATLEKTWTLVQISLILCYPSFRNWTKVRKALWVNLTPRINSGAT